MMTLDPMESIDRRLEALETKLLFSEDLVDRLNEVVTRQQDQIDALQRHVQALRRQVATLEPSTFTSLRDELPPHY